MNLTFKLKALVLALVLTAGLSVPALAAEEAQQGDIVVLYTNDVHCGVDTNLGYAALAGYKAQMEAAYGADRVTLVDLGDAVQGDVIGSLSDGAWIIDIMNYLGYDMAIPGNHEFDYGMDQFFALTQQAQFPYLCCNFMDLTTGESVFDAYQMVSYGDVDVAYVAIGTPESIIKSTPTYFQNEDGDYIYSFCSGEDGSELYDRVQETVDEALAQGADYVVALGHLGVDPSSSPWTSTDVIANTTGIDVFLDGHSHSTIPSQEVANAEGEPVLLSQTGTKLSAIGQLTISADGQLSTQLITEYTDTSSSAYTQASAYIQGIQQEYQSLTQEVVASSQVLLTIGDPDSAVRLIRSQETNLGDLCADAYRVMLGADIGLVNGGGIRASIQPGDVTYGDIIQVHPYSNMLCLVEVTGQQILDALEHAYQQVGVGESGGFLQLSGLTCTIDPAIPSSVVTDDNGMFLEVAGPRRVSNVRVLDSATGTYSPLDPAASYSVACHDYYLYSQGDGFSMFGTDHVTVLKDRTMVDSEVLIRYITEELGGVITEQAYGQPQGRITILSHNAQEPVSPEEPDAETSAQPEQPEESAASQQADTYQVQAGDSLWRIAQEVYGSGRYWEAIFQANASAIHDPNMIYIGQVLVLPEVSPAA